MSLRTITCWAVYYPKQKRILNGFRTRKELKRYYPLGIPIYTVLVKMKGRYLPAKRRSMNKRHSEK